MGAAEGEEKQASQEQSLLWMVWNQSPTPCTPVRTPCRPFVHRGLLRPKQRLGQVAGDRYRLRDWCGWHHSVCSCPRDSGCACIPRPVFMDWCLCTSSSDNFDLPGQRHALLLLLWPLCVTVQLLLLAAWEQADRCTPALAPCSVGQKDITLSGRRVQRLKDCHISSLLG